jgi:hypothetical protein
MTIKTYNVHYFNGHFYEKGTGRRLIPKPESEYAIVAQPFDFLERDLFNTPPAHIRSPQEMEQAILAERSLEKYAHLQPTGTKIYFRFGLSKTDRKNERRQYEFQVELLEDLFLYRKTTMKREASCYDCACVMNRELSQELPFQAEEVFGKSLNDIFQKVSQLYFAGKRSSSINVFNEFYMAPGQRSFNLEKLREQAKFKTPEK